MEKEKIKEILKKANFNLDLRRMDIFHLSGDGSARNYFRILLDEKNFILASDSGPQKITTATHFLDVHTAFHDAHVRVPHIYFSDVQEGIILQEDLGDISFANHLATLGHAHEEYSHYQTLVDELIKIHSIIPERYEGKDFTAMSFDTEKLMWEVHFTFEHLLEGHLGVNLDPDKKNKINQSFTKITEKIVQQKKVVTHRDFHSRNIMYKNKEFIIIDFQDARMGIPQYDLVSLLEDCYYKLNPENIARLKRYYWDKFLNPRKLQSSWDEFNYYYDLMAIQRLFKALGSFGYISKTKNNPKFIRYIGYTFENLRYILGKHPEFFELKKTLSGIYYGA